VRSTTATNHVTKLAPTLRSATGLIEVSLASSVRFVFSRHDTRFRDPTRFPFGMFFRPRIDSFRDERFGFVHFVEPTSDVFCRLFASERLLSDSLVVVLA
jgi:hypothetical protein